MPTFDELWGGDTPKQNSFDALWDNTPSTSTVQQTPSLWEHPIDALTSKDWWTTRPSGEKVGLAQSVAGPALSALNGLTFGFGDEISAGGSTLWDALRGNLGGQNIGDAYDQRLAQARDIQKSFSDATPIASGALQLAGGLKTPIIDAVGQLGKVLPKATSLTGALGRTGALTTALAGEGALYSGLSGFGSGEGAQDRFAKAEEGAKSGAKWSAALGLPLFAASELAAKYAPTLENQGEKLVRKSIGTRESDYGKTAKELDVWDIEDGQVETLTKKAIDYLDEKGSFGNDRNPQRMLTTVLNGEKKVNDEIGGLIREADKRGASVSPTFDRALQYIAEGNIPANEVDTYIEKLDKLGSGISREGQGKLSYLQKQKIAVGSKYTPEDGAANGFWRAVYTDLQKTIEDAVPGIKGLNEESQKFKIVKPIVQRNLSKEEASTWLGWIQQNIRTSGGTLTTPAIIGALSGGTVGGPIGAILGAGLATASTPRGQQILGETAKTIAKNPNMLSAPASKIPSAVRSIIPHETDSQLSLPQQTEQIQSKPLLPYKKDTTDFIDKAIGKAQDKISGKEDTAYMPKNEKSDLVKAVTYVESRGNPKAVSPKGATGLMQIMPATAKEIAAALGIKKYDLKDPETNQMFGEYYLNKMLKAFDGDHKLALAAYNWGIGNVRKALKLTGGSTFEDIKEYLPTETARYVPSVLKRMKVIQV